MRAAVFMRALADVIDALDGKKGKTEKPDFQQNPVPMTPQQQALELQKAELGKNSPAIDKLLADEEIGAEDENLPKNIGNDTDARQMAKENIPLSFLGKKDEEDENK